MAFNFFKSIKTPKEQLSNYFQIDSKEKARIDLAWYEITASLYGAKSNQNEYADLEKHLLIMDLIITNFLQVTRLLLQMKNNVRLTQEEFKLLDLSFRNVSKLLKDYSQMDKLRLNFPVFDDKKSAIVMIQMYMRDCYSDKVELQRCIRTALSYSKDFIELRHKVCVESQDRFMFSNQTVQEIYFSKNPTELDKFIFLNNLLQAKYNYTMLRCVVVRPELENYFRKIKLYESLNWDTADKRSFQKPMSYQIDFFMGKINTAIDLAVKDLSKVRHLKYYAEQIESISNTCNLFLKNPEQLTEETVLNFSRTVFNVVQDFNSFIQTEPNKVDVDDLDIISSDRNYGADYDPNFVILEYLFSLSVNCISICGIFIIAVYFVYFFPNFKKYIFSKFKTQKKV